MLTTLDVMAPSLYQLRVLGRSSSCSRCEMRVATITVTDYHRIPSHGTQGFALPRFAIHDCQTLHMSIFDILGRSTSHVLDNSSDAYLL